MALLATRLQHLLTHMKTRLNVGGKKGGRTSDVEGPMNVLALGPKMTKSVTKSRDIMVTHRETATRQYCHNMDRFSKYCCFL